MSLKGKRCEFFTNGGWSFGGEVVDEEDERVIISEDDEIILIYKKDVVAVKVLKESEKKAILSTLKSQKKQEGDIPKSDEDSQYGIAFIPADMLIESEEKEVDNTFSISFSDFRMEEDFGSKNADRK